MDASGDQSDEQQLREKSIAIEEQKTIESQEGAVDEGSTEDVNESPAITTSPIQLSENYDLRLYHPNQLSQLFDIQ